MEEHKLQTKKTFCNRHSSINLLRGRTTRYLDLLKIYFLNWYTFIEWIDIKSIIWSIEFSKIREKWITNFLAYHINVVC